MSDSTTQALKRQAARDGSLVATMRDEGHRLCYVEGGFAWFTTLPVTGEGAQWGDDWDDAPYQHNAGNPYGCDDRQERRWTLRVVGFRGCHMGMQEPMDGHTISVEEINRGSVPWLKPWTRDDEDDVTVWAGCSLTEFVAKIQRAGGTVFLPLDGSGV
jgi:hypothetical protein